MCTHKRFYEVKCLYINLYKTTIARNQTCAWGLSEYLPMGLAARNVVCPEMLSKQRY